MSNLTKQVQKARSAQRFASVIQRDHQKRAQSVLVPGSNAKIYRVILRRTPAFTAELNIQTNSGLVKPHFAFKTLTYHAMAAVMVAARENGYTVRWCQTLEDAKNLSNLGGTPFTLYNFDNHANALYGVYVK